MTLKDFLNMYVGLGDIKDSLKCYIADKRYYTVWTNKKEDNLFIGNICNIPQELLQRKFDKWDILENCIVIILK